MDRKEARKICNLDDELYDLDEEVKNLCKQFGHSGLYVCHDTFNGFFESKNNDAHLTDDDLHLLIDRRISRVNEIKKELDE